VAIRINQTQGTVEVHQVSRVFRSPIGDWCVELVIAGWTNIAVLDYHPSIPMLRILRNSGTDIADGVIDQGAEGIDVRRRTRLPDESEPR
jgi:hypothetical protein